MHEHKVKILLELDHATYMKAYARAMDQDLEFDQFVRNSILLNLL